jgi:amino-acid N-acetyltransferase
VRELLRAAGLPTEGVDLVHGFVVARAGRRIVAAAGVERHGNDGLLRSVVVDPAWRGRRAGEAVVSRLLARADADGLAAVYLLTTTADGWFPRFGFGALPRDEAPAEIRACGEFAAVCPASATLMVRHRAAPATATAEAEAGA